MKDKDKPESTDTNKTESSSRTRTAKPRARRTGAKAASRAQKAGPKSAEKTTDSKARKSSGTRTRARAKRTKPRSAAPAGDQERSTQTTAGTLVQDVSGQLPSAQYAAPAEQGGPSHEDPGAAALAEWGGSQTGTATEERRHRGRRPSRTKRGQGSTKRAEAAAEPAAPAGPSKTVPPEDLPAWPELEEQAQAESAEPTAEDVPEVAELDEVLELRQQVRQEFLPSESAAQTAADLQAPPAETAPSEAPPKKGRRRRRRRRGRHRNHNGEAIEEPKAPSAAPQTAQRTTAGRQPAALPKLAEPAEPEEEPWGGEDVEEKPQRPSDKHGRLMLINVAEGEECRIAILHQKRLEELFIERASAESHVGNIYKGRVTNVEPSIQAAFVDFGLPKNGFLHISDLQPQYFPGGLKSTEEVGRKTPRRDRPPIQKCLRRGQEIIVQIIKEGIGTKGPTLTTYISIPGRYLVMMPGMNRLGVSRRIEDEDARRKMRAVLDELNLPKEMGFILRTAGLDRTKRELQQDLLYLQRLWKVVARRIKNERAPCELYRESDLVIRTIRDVFSSDFSRIIVDDEKTTDKVRDFLAIAMPRSSAPVDLYSGRRPLFHEYKLEQEIDRINSRYVPLPSGGSLVIESTEALVAIDVNSGKYREHDDAEETAYRINLEAAEEIARQLRLRDLGGLILCDFIDMRAEKHRRGVERALREALKKHKERAKCLRMSQFGIIEMTRQRMRPSIKRSIYRDCSHCRGTGLVKNTESMTLDIMRLLRLATHNDHVDTVEVRVAPEVAFQLQNRKRAAIYSVEKQTGRRIIIRADENLGPDQYAFECLDRRGGPVRMDDLPDTARSMPEPRARRRSAGAVDAKSLDNGRETLEDVFD